MSTVMTGQESTPAPHHRRSREEVEALAKNFVATPVVEDAAPPKSRAVLIGGIAGAAVLVAAVAYVALPSRADTSRNADAARAAAAAEVEQLRQRMEAERERARKELEAGQDYLARIAAADAALVKDLTAQADRLADRQAALARSAPVSSDAPTPRDETRPAAPAPKPGATTTTASPAATTTAKAAPAQPAPSQPAATAAQSAPAPAQAQAQPTQVAQAEKSECAIHVSELSSSGKLTYESIKKMKGVRIDEGTGHVFTPPVPAAGGRTVVFEVMPDGCVRVGRR